jgi:hypothetical protein
MEGGLQTEAALQGCPARLPAGQAALRSAGPPSGTVAHLWVTTLLQRTALVAAGQASRADCTAAAAAAAAPPPPRRRRMRRECRGSTHAPPLRCLRLRLRWVGTAVGRYSADPCRRHRWPSYAAALLRHPFASACLGRAREGRGGPATAPQAASCPWCRRSPPPPIGMWCCCRCWSREL